MDLVGAMLLRSLRDNHATQITATQVLPRMPALFRRLSPVVGGRTAINADRLLGRFVEYPRRLRKMGSSHDLYHIVDHSYAHLVHALPGRVTVVTCHDLDTFRSILEPAREPRGWAFREMTRRILTGLQRATFVTCDSVATQDEILSHGLVPTNRVEVVPLGVSPIMSPAPDAIADAVAQRLLGPEGPRIDLLHVGSTISRKRIDVLLRVVAAVRAQLPEVRLVRCGGALTDSQETMARALGLGAGAIAVLPFLSPAELAAVYRRAALVLQPSEAEGFGLPVVEAMACGAQVVASDLPVLREVGGTAACYCRVGDVPGWASAVQELLRERRHDKRAWACRQAAAQRQASHFSWSKFSGRVVDVYHRVARERP